MPLSLPPLSLYIHVPWCVRKCPYCDFNSHAARETLPELEYINALLDDLNSESEYLQGRSIESIFIGGGTPSLFSADSYKQLFEGIQKQVTLKHDAEITLEANPGTFEQEKFQGFRDAGINRLSLGIQSFNDHQLSALGRIHSGQEAIKAATLARDIFDNINLDLMHGLPAQSIQGALNDIETSLKLKPDHLSWYQLTIEPNTEFHAKPPSLPVDETLWDIQEQGQALLSDAGFKQYEISAYARSASKRSRHNLNYWHFGDYLGIGAGAHGKITQEDGQITRRWKQKQPKAYMQPETRLVGNESIPEQELAFEFMLNALRLYDGVNSSLLTERTGLPASEVEQQLQLAITKGLLENSADRIKPTPQGRLFLNDLLEIFL